MPRILRNYLISFAIIGAFFLTVYLIDRYVEQHSVPQSPQTSEPRRPVGQPSR